MNCRFHKKGNKKIVNLNCGSIAVMLYSRYVVRFIMLWEFNSLHLILLILFLYNNKKSI